MIGRTILLACTLAACSFGAEGFYEAIRNNSLGELKTLVKNGGVNEGDRRGTTPLMFAAAYGSLDAMKLLIDAGADVNATNALGSSALMWCATDIEKVRLLISKGADVNARSKNGRNALLIASGTEGASPIVKLLLDSGADLKKADASPVSTPLAAAGNAPDAATLKLLLDRGAEVRGPSGAFALMQASSNGDVASMRLLLDRGVDVNSTSPPFSPLAVKNGNIELGTFTPLILAAAYGGYDAVKLLLDSKANVNAQDTRGMTPLMLALASDRPDARVVKLLLERGADPGIKSKLGETAADWARKYNQPEVIAAVKTSPGKFATATMVKPLSVREAVEKSTALLQRATETFFVEGGCPACHSHNLTAMTLKVVRAAGVKVDEAKAAKTAQEARAFWAPQDQTLTLRLDAPGGADMVEYGLFQFAAEGVKPATFTDAMVHNLAATQQVTGNWHLGGIARSPMEDGDFARTAMGLRSIQLYGPAGRQSEWAQRVAKAAAWLREAKPYTAEDRNFQLLGLKWAGADRAAVERLSASIARTQRPDGGWAQTQYLPSDAYATGQTLYALREAGMAVTDSTYRKGMDFLLKTQMTDGSWYVRSRAPKFQPYFQSGFPHDHDQWISMAGTAWATMALGYGLDREKRVAD